MDNVIITEQAIDCLNRNSIPADEENILTDFGEDAFVNAISLVVYFRDANDCPFGRGNWIGDVNFSDGSILCIKLPKEMSVEKMKSYFSPFHEFLKSKMIRDEQQITNPQ